MQKVIYRIIVVSIFAVAMAYLESAIVMYLRDIYNIQDVVSDMVTEVDKYIRIEFGRELCTLVMLFGIGWIAGTNWQERIGYMIISFGIWDIFYYIWLVVFIHWPASLFEWDILFLIPLPWWGPVISPILIALLMIMAGIIAVAKSYKKIIFHFSLTDWLILGGSLLLALFVFMNDAINALPGGLEAVKNVKPTHFNWPLFFISLLGMAYFIYRGLRQKTNSVESN